VRCVLGDELGKRRSGTRAALTDFGYCHVRLSFPLSAVCFAARAAAGNHAVPAMVTVRELNGQGSAGGSEGRCSLLPRRVDLRLQQA